MKKYLNFIIIIGIIFSCKTSTNNDIIENNIEYISKYEFLNTNDTIVEKNEQSNKLILVNNGSLKPAKEIQINGIDFNIVRNDLEEIIYLSTNDKRFKTPENFGIGLNWDEIPDDLKSRITRMAGWGFSIKLNSGWELGFCEGNSCTDTEPNYESNVKWIFKRKE